MKVVVALGGNALLKRGEPLEAGVQLQNVARAAAAVASVARTHKVIVTHGNGPQVGLLALQAASYPQVPPYPLDVLGADALLLLTDVDAVYLGWGTDQQRALRETSPEELRQHAFAPGSMKPKVDAVCRFVEAGGGFAGIGRLEDAVAILLGQYGTIVRAPEMALDFVRRSGLPPRQ